MSLADKFEEYAKADADERYETTEQMMKAAFYAGAESAQSLVGDSYTKFLEIQAEIDHFRSHK